MTEKKDAYAFISYSSDNRNEALRLYEVLTNKRHRITCWLDVVDLNSLDMAFQEQIIRGITNASCLILVETQESKKSDYVDLELRTALQHNTPTFRYKVHQNESSFIESLRMFLLAQKVKFRTTQPYWITLVILVSFLAIMGFALFFFGRTLTPVFSEAVNRILPEAAQISINLDDIEEIIKPEIAAPFHYIPSYYLQQDGFDDTQSFDYGALYFDISAQNEDVSAMVENGSLTFQIPKICTQQNEYSCEIEIHSQGYNLEQLQYFAFRAKINSMAENQNLSLSISIPSWTRTRSGFGWNLSQHVTPFFRSSPALPEPEFYAHVEIDEKWHAYEILLDPQESLLYYYVDGQLIDTHKMQFYEDWKTAPICLIIYALGNINESMDVTSSVDTYIEVDELIVGGFDQAL